MHRIVVEPTEDGWRVRRPGWPDEVVASRTWAERAAESIAYEFHERSGRPACVVVQGDEPQALIARFG